MRRRRLLVSIVSVLLAAAPLPLRAQDWVRTSQYVAVRDGVRLAVDVVRPAANGQPVAERLPVVWQFTPYRRAVKGSDGRIRSIADDPSMQALLRAGYVVAIADVRGKGASFGVRREVSDLVEARDGYDINEWLAAQPWSNGVVGMVGCSYLGATVLGTAGEKPPHLKAIVVGDTAVDAYNAWVRGGVVRKFRGNADPTPENELQSAPVDSDADGALLRAAVAEHAANTAAQTFFGRVPRRDSASPITGRPYWIETSASSHMKAITDPSLGKLLHAGWYDTFRREITLLQRNSPGSKLVIGPWAHCGGAPTHQPRQARFAGWSQGDAMVEFFDYWLKGKKNGWIAQPAVKYARVNATDWRTAAAWPPTAEGRPLYLSGGALTRTPSVKGALEHRVMDGRASHGEEIVVPARAEQGLSFTTAPLDRPLELGGYPLAEIWATSPSDDFDAFVYLEDLAPDGKGVLISEGRLRASARKLGTPGYDTAGQPWISARVGDSQPGPIAKPERLMIDMLPVAAVLPAGHRLRLVISGADDAGEALPPVPGGRRFTVHTGGGAASRILIPVAAAR